jgi:hypothetical protein
MRTYPFLFLRTELMIRLKTKVLIITSVLILSGVIPAAKAARIQAINPSNGHTYVLLEQSSWSDAEAEAQTLGGHLATIDNEQENLWVHNAFGSLDAIGIWIGLYDEVGENRLEDYKWIDGSDSTYRNWDPTYNEPNSQAERWVGIFTNIDPRGRGPGWNDFDNDDADLGLPMRGLVELASPGPDGDSDGVPDNEDNCPNDPNPDQSDVDGDLVGDVCDPGFTTLEISRDTRFVFADIDDHANARLAVTVKTEDASSVDADIFVDGEFVGISRVGIPLPVYIPIPEPPRFEETGVCDIDEHGQFFCSKEVVITATPLDQSFDAPPTETYLAYTVTEVVPAILSPPLTYQEVAFINDRLKSGVGKYCDLPPSFPPKMLTKWTLLALAVEQVICAVDEVLQQEVQIGDIVSREIWKAEAPGVNTAFLASLELVFQEGIRPPIKRGVWTENEAIAQELFIGEDGNPQPFREHALLFELHSPASLVVTDPNGLQAGYNPSTDEVFADYPAMVSDPGVEPFLLYVVEPDPGNYSVEVIGTGTGNYTLTTYFTDEYGNVDSLLTYPGVIQEDEIQTENVHLDEASIIDGDSDGVLDVDDICPADSENDGDLDGVCGDVDNCPSVPNSDQADSDGDSVGDVCDNCPEVANADQLDTDENGVGDACEATPVQGDLNGNGDIDMDDYNAFITTFGKCAGDGVYNPRGGL